MSTGVQTAVGKFVWHDHGSTGPGPPRRSSRGLVRLGVPKRFKPGEIDYEMVETNGQLHGGFGSPLRGILRRPRWMGHVLVKDVDEAVAPRRGCRRNDLGSSPMDMPEVGRMAVIADRQGAVHPPRTLPQG